MDRSYNNVLFLTVDCLRYDHIQPHITPNICGLINEGLLYTNAYAEYAHTQWSFGTLFQTDWIFEVKKAGYYTMGITYNAYLSKIQGYDRGFDFYHDITDNKLGPKFIDDSKVLNNIFFTELLKRYTTPFFSWIHYMDCHSPYYPRDFGDPHMSLVDCGVMIREITPKTIEDIKRAYKFSVQYLDSNIGTLIAMLKRIGIYHKTSIVLSADHGEELYEHYKFGHDPNRNNEEVLHIPLIVKGHRKGVNDSKILFRDISSIILNICKNNI